MTDQLDLNTIAAEAASQLIKDTLSSTFSKISGAARFAYEAMFTDFEVHLQAVYQRIATVKIITSKDQPVNFSSIYTTSGFSCANTKYTDDQLIETLLSGKRCVLSGSGGAGKTFMLRNIWLEIFKRRSKKVPILIELRKLNSLSTYDLFNFIRANAFGSFDLNEKSFRYFCEQGLFVFLLDGFDEVVKEKRADLEKQILAVSRKYVDCGLIISGRPDDRFDAWSDFYTFKSLPFSFNQFRVLITKVPFDEETKKAFLKVATNSFFEEHQSFLSNPLLSLMMLLTFRDNAEIPSRLSTFYENCFSTLYTQHDALKESFNRKKSLDQLSFKRLFSAFSLVTYLASRPTLDGAEFIQAIEKAKAIADVDVSVEDISHDLLESVNLLVKDGMSYTYIHRSFQEFFAAYCVSSVLSTKQEDIIAKFSKRTYDSTLRLTYELHPKLVEDKLIVPRYQKLKGMNKLPRKQQKDLPYNAVSKAGLSFQIMIGRAVSKARGSMLFYVSEFQILWDEDYQILTPATLVAKKDYTGTTNALFEDILDMAVFGLVRKIQSEAVLEDSSYEVEVDGEVLVKFSFTPEKALVTIVGDDEDQPAHIIDILTKCRLMVDESASGLEKTIIDNNKNIVDVAEAVLSGRGKHDFILSEVIL